MAGALLTLLTVAFLLPAPVADPVADPDTRAAPWGEAGHAMAAQAAVELLPSTMPAFVRAADQQLAWLNPEPDRWRSRELGPMDQAFSYDHYIDFENVPPGSLEAPDRWRFVAALYEAGLTRPERDVGFLPYRIEEMYQRVLAGFRRWRSTRGAEREWIEERILNDAGILGHYVTDGSQPHHTTIHFNGWNASSAQQAPNPEEFSTERDFHGRFETAFVRAHVRIDDLRARMPREPRTLGTPVEVRAAIHTFLRQTHAEVGTLYRLEKQSRFTPDGPPPRGHVEFTADRLAAGAAFLGDLWWSAWIDSARVPPDDVR